MFKQEEIMTPKEAREYEGCSVCELHARAYKKVEEILGDHSDTEDLCPLCNGILNEHGGGYSGHVIVGGHNGYTPHERIGYHELRWCEKCKKYFALIPEEVIYNANHDIFYTGGHYFLTPSDEEEIISKIEEEFKRHTKDFVKRVKAGEIGLNDCKLSYWNLNSIGNVISDYLYSKGLKK